MAMTSSTRILLAWAVLSAAVGAEAGSATDNFNVTASVPGSLTVSATTMDFGDLDGSGYVEAQAILTLAGSAGITGGRVSISGGGHMSGNRRHLSDGNGNTVAYDLYYLEEVGEGEYELRGWGDDGVTHISRSVYVYKSSSSFTTRIIYGEADNYMPGQAPGVYSDTVLLTVTW